MSKDNHAELKRLQRAQYEAESLAKKLTRERDNLEKQLADAQAAAAQAAAEIEALKNQGGVVVVSEHAILRHLERVSGLDIEDVKRMVLPLEVERQVLKMGDGKYPVFEGGKLTHTVVVKDGHVVTVLTGDER